MTTSKPDLRRDASRTASNRAAAARVVRANASAAYARLCPTIIEWRVSGLSLGQIAEALNTAGETTRKGALFKGVTVARILRRANVPN